MSKEEIRRIQLSTKIFPFFKAFSGDLLFVIAIGTLFLTRVKGLNAAQISFLTTISCIVTILLQVPVLKIIKKIGNANSVRLGTFLLLCSVVVLTFGKSYSAMLLYKILYGISWMFKNMENVLLKNNLVYEKRSDEYFKVLNKSNTLYASITMIVALLSGYLFNMNSYLPMYCSIIICILTFLASFILVDVTNNPSFKYNCSKKKTKISNIAIFILISYALFLASLSIGQSNTKLFMQYELEHYLSAENIAYYISIIVVASRITRILVNLLFIKIDKKLKDKLPVVLSFILFLSFILIIIGHILPFHYIIKTTIMTFGFCFIVAIRDPFKVYMQDLILKTSQKEEQQKLTSYLGLYEKTVSLIISLIFSLVLLKFEMIYIIIILSALALLQVAIAIELFIRIKKINNVNTNKEIPI